MQHQKKKGVSRALALAAGLSLVAGVLPAAHAVGGAAPAAPITANDAFEDGSYIVVLKDQPLATFPATAGSATSKVDTTSATAISHTERLLSQQAAALASVEAEATHNYTVALNGFSAKLTGEQAAALAARGDVVSVTPSKMRTLSEGETYQLPDGVNVPATEESPDFLGLRGEGGVWEQVGGPMEAGRGMVVGVIDTGIAYDNPSFSGEGMPDAPEGWAGECEPGEDGGLPADACNGKIIGATYHVEGLRAAGFEAEEAVNPIDNNGHGSHVAGTAAGREITVTGGGEQFDMAGMAPGAHLSSYKVCWDFEYEGGVRNGCFDEDSVAAIDQALADGVDVLNFSISGDPTLYNNPVDMAFKNATAAGVFVAAASGNEGEEGGTANHIGPWMTTVGAATHRGDDAPVIAPFSNPGPVAVADEEQTVLKPDLGAPGVEVLAAIYSEDGTPNWAYLSGTSMASPHVAGLGALLAGENPDWSPMAVKSAMQTSARDYTDAESNAAFEGGTGFVEPRSFLSPGLVFDSTEADWDAFLADPANGYELNTAYVVVPALGTTPTTVTRTVTNPGDAEATFTAAYEGPETLQVEVSPASVTVPAGGSAEVTITVANTGAAADAWQEGDISWTAGETVVEIPVVARGAVADVEPEPEPGPEIDRVYGADRYGTAAGVSALFPEGVDTVYVASGQGFADALAGSAPAASGLLPQGVLGTQNTPDGDPAPVLLTRNDELMDETVAALDALEPSNIIILGGEGAINADVAEDLGEYGEVSRVEGANRYETAANLALMFDDVDTVYVASGDDRAYADALAGAARAGMENAPVILTRQDELHSAAQEALETLAPANVVILGGSVAISDDVETALGEFGEVDRLAGEDRYATAVAISQVHDADASVVYIASGQNYPDALAGSSLAGYEGVPVLLTKQDRLSSVTADELERLNPERIVVLGGSVAVSEDVVNEIEDIWND
ncbi:cell wall-binding repeat-containing protein [Ornithinimicrobium sufpigmenti]|uniref:cell wall-binding repeat-containing protein n=1 Tax=Ornithinimicrobium sufpigmenti TaxID=2508882 RepID=UPI001036907F|nr:MULTISPECIES: cell wall-binding repeat-containing protein [unclassified Ornithinimicrobium]